MDREEGMDALRRSGWLRDTPAEFRDTLLSQSRWQRLDAGALIQTGGEEQGELIGLARGIVELRTVLARADTPIMHFAHPVFWFGFIPIVASRPRTLAASAKTPIWIARVPQAEVGALLAERPEWWRHFIPPSLVYADVATTIAADLLIRDSERRCAAVLLRLGGRRFAGPDDKKPVEVSVTQDDLAGAANLSRTSVRSMLGRLAARGLIEQGYGGIAVRAPAALRAFVDDG
jgi:CRP/FNR family transcriptional regulator, cyclic AMP receptor protein